jgi:cation diffusion facilitator CzcD-associated flavoprotein CzcO
LADATYDAVIIGAGHNGLTLGTYLARCGWEVAIFEKRAEEGGGLCTEELTRAGFLHNVHCNYHTLVGVSRCTRPRAQSTVCLRAAPRADGINLRDGIFCPHGLRPDKTARWRASRKRRRHFPASLRGDLGYPT